MDGDLTQVTRSAIMDAGDRIVSNLEFESNGGKEVNATMLIKVPSAEVSLPDISIPPLLLC